MVRLLRDETLVATWTNFFEENYKSEIETIALEYPEKRSLFVDYWTIDKTDSSLADRLVNDPYKTIFNAEEALKDIDTSIDEKLCIHFRIKNLPLKIGIRDLRSKYAGKLITIEGLVKRATYVRPIAGVAAFQCNKCGAIIRIEQDDEDILKEPSECYEDQGGCGRVSSFKLSTNLSAFDDFQKIEIQENPDALKGAEQPQMIEVHLEDDLVGKLSPGDRVQLVGILHTRQRRRGTFRLRTFDYILEGISIEIGETAYEEINISKEEEKKILKISKDPDIYNKMRQSIAPTIYGMDIEKEALVLQLFGGVQKITIDGTKIRGDIHILLVGDPGTAKSQLLNSICRVAPRSILAAGTSSTKAGLTATAVKDEFGDGRWTLEAGALVLANNGLCCIDEFDKMNEEDRGSMHPAMEQQEIPIAKAGISARLKSKCAILAAANPKLGRFNNFIPIHEQINLKPTMLSRFDLIFSIVDEPKKKSDKALSSHIMRIHRAYEIAENMLRSKKTKFSKKQRDSLINETLAIFEPVFLRKYIAYAKRNVFPVMTEEASEFLENYYVDFRSSSEKSIPFTPRQLDGFVRLTEANARVRLSNEATIEDAKRAIFIVNKYLMRVGIDRETGKFDIDIIATGFSHSQHEQMRTIIDVIKRLCGESSDGNAARSDIISEAEISGMESSKVEEALDRLKRNGQIYEPMHGKYRLSEY